MGGKGQETAGGQRWGPHHLGSHGVTQLASLTLRKPEREEVWGMGASPMGPIPHGPCAVSALLGPGEQEGFHAWRALLLARRSPAAQPLSLMIGKKSKWGYFSICR